MFANLKNSPSEFLLVPKRGGGRSLYEVTRKGDVFPKIHSFAPGIRHRGNRALSYLHLAYTQFLITISVLS